MTNLFILTLNYIDLCWIVADVVSVARCWSISVACHLFSSTSDVTVSFNHNWYNSSVVHAKTQIAQWEGLVFKGNMRSLILPNKKNSPSGSTSSHPRACVQFSLSHDRHFPNSLSAAKLCGTLVRLWDNTSSSTSHTFRRVTSSLFVWCC